MALVSLNTVVITHGRGYVGPPGHTSEQWRVSSIEKLSRSPIYFLLTIATMAPVLA